MGVFEFVREPGIEREEGKENEEYLDDANGDVVDALLGGVIDFLEAPGPGGGSDEALGFAKEKVQVPGGASQLDGTGGIMPDIEGFGG